MLRRDATILARCRQHMSPPVRPTPLWAVLAVTIINSLGTGVVINGIFFLAKSRYGFTAWESFLLGVVIGVTYIPAALGIGPFLKRMARRSERVTTRGVLAAITAVMAGMCFLPLAADKIGGGSGEWAVWAFIGAYSPLSGVLWPIVESYVSGGRRGASLGRATGQFNIAWSAAVAGAFWLIAPFVEPRPLEVIAGLGAVQAAGLVLLMWFTAEPARHAEHHEPHPASYRRFLTIFRLQLPASYVVIAALSSYIPFTLQKLGTAAVWETPITSVWMAARIGVFALMGATAGWHGRWWPAFAGGILMVAGFAAVVGSAFVPGMGLISLVAGLAAFGVGASIVYTAALYYVMEVGNTEVSAGGSHEALIGVGYTLGPLCGLGAIGVREAGLASSLEWPMVTFVTLAVVIFALYAFWKALGRR